jgi:hypothetical protein
MEQDFMERVFGNLTVLSLGAPLISACLRLGRQDSLECASSQHAEPVDVHASLAWLRSMTSPIIRSFKQSIRKVLTRPKIGRKLASSAAS